jgi:hypothetical protein
MTFDKKIFKQILEQDSRWEIKNHDYEGNFTQEIKIEKIVKEPDILNIIEPENTSLDEKLKSSDYTVSEFRKQIESFTQEEIEIFIKDSRKTISNEAKKQLRKLVG